MKKRKIIFLDRDGIINKKPAFGDYVKSWKEFIFLPEAIKALRLLNKKGYETYIVSNQAGIGRGLMSEKDLKDIHRKMKIKLAKSGAKIAGIYYCPHATDDNCGCRKPKPGMILKAAKEHNINLKEAIFIGDEKRDAQAGKAAGLKMILVNDKTHLYKIAKRI